MGADRVDEGREHEDRRRVQADRTHRPEHASERPAHAVLGLQRAAGNQAVNAVVRRSLQVGRADDSAEAAADRVAEEILSAAGATAVHRDHGAGADRLGGTEVEPGVAEAISRTQGSGQPLAPAVRQPAESVTGADLSGVRVHTDSTADELSRSLEARAFTVGSDIYFSQGTYQPGTSDGLQLAAHEAAHVAQQQAGGVRRSATVHRKKDKKAPDPAKDKKKEDKKKVQQAKLAEQQRKKEVKAKREHARTQISEMKEEMGSKDPNDLKLLQQRFQELLDKEMAMRGQLEKGGLDPDEAEAKAYEEVWLKAPEDLRVLRPMRENSSEKLARATEKSLTEMGSAKTTDEYLQQQLAMGTLLPKKVEKLFDQEVKLREATFAKRMQEMSKGGKTPSAEEIEVMRAKVYGDAYKTIWFSVPEEVSSKRPSPGSALEIQAYQDAEKRVAIRSLYAPPDEKEDKLSDTLSEYGDPIVGGVSTGVGVSGKMTGTFGSKSNQGAEKKTWAEKNFGGSDPHKESAKVKSGEKEDVTRDEAAAGVLGEIKGMLGAVWGSLKSFVKFAEDIKALNEQGGDFNDKAKAAKDITDGMAGATSIGLGVLRSIAAVSRTNQASLASAIPGVSIAVAALRAAAAYIDGIAAARRLGYEDGSIFRARAEDHPELVLPLSRTRERNSILLEKSMWNVGKEFEALAAGIVTVASGGLLAPATQIANFATGILDTCHTIVHVVIDDRIAALAKSSQKHYALKDEGSAEERLRRDVEFAVASLVTAALSDDPGQSSIARGALEAYGNFDWAKLVGTESGHGDRGRLMGVILDRVIAVLEESRDPKRFVDGIKDKIHTVSSKVSQMRDTKSDVDMMAEERNAIDGKERGAGWKFKMFLKGVFKNKEFQRSMRKTQVNSGKDLKSAKEQRQRDRNAPSTGPEISGPITNSVSLDGDTFDLTKVSEHIRLRQKVQAKKPDELKKQAEVSEGVPHEVWMAAYRSRLDDEATQEAKK